MGLEAIDQKLDKLKAELRDLSSTYGDKYPEIRKVKDQIAKTEVAARSASGRHEG